MKDLQQMAEREQAAEKAQAKKEVKDFNELELYFFIEECGYFCWRMNHDMADGRIPQSDHAKIDIDVAKVRERQIEAIKELQKFGVENPLKEDGRANDTYWSWYKKWKSWHHGMGDEQWQEVNAAIKNGVTVELLEKYRKEANEIAGITN